VILYVHIRHGAYACQAQVHGANHSRPTYVLCFLCEKILVISVIVILICEYGIDMFV